MRNSFDARQIYSPSTNPIYSKLFDGVSSNKSSTYGNNDDGVDTPNSDASKRRNNGRHFSSGNMKGADNFNLHLDQEVMELLSRTRAQKDEIIHLHEQIADACVKELQLLNEKHALERKISDLRMAHDEKQHDAITSALKELARRKVDLEENLNLANECRAVEDETYIFTSSMLSLLAEYGMRPNVMNALSISNSAKHLYDQLQGKIRTFHASISEMSTMIEYQAGVPQIRMDSHHVNQKIPDVSYSHTVVSDQQLKPSSDMLRFQRGDNQIDIGDIEVASLSAFMSLNSNLVSASGQITDTPLVPTWKEEPASAVPEEYLKPGIEEFQIIGDAKPGNTLLACGYPVRGTSLCIFQWVHHLQDGTWQYIEGATNPNYVVTADDVDKLIAVECVPMDDNGQQGDLVRLFANDQRKIACDSDVQLEIETYISAGRATFDTLLLIDEGWKKTRFILNRSSFQVKHNSKDLVVIEEKYSAGLCIKIPSGFSSQFVLTCSDGTSHPFSTYSDVRARDTLVLTMRIFQSKASNDKSPKEKM